MFYPEGTFFSFLFYYLAYSFSQRLQPSNAYFMMFSSERSTEVQKDSTSQTDGTTSILFTTKVQQYDIEMFCFFHAISEGCMS